MSLDFVPHNDPGLVEADTSKALALDPGCSDRPPKGMPALVRRSTRDLVGDYGRDRAFRHWAESPARLSSTLPRRARARTRRVPARASHPRYRPAVPAPGSTHRTFRRGAPAAPAAALFDRLEPRGGARRGAPHGGDGALSSARPAALRRRLRPFRRPRCGSRNDTRSSYSRIRTSGFRPTMCPS